MNGGSMVKRIVTLLISYLISINIYSQVSHVTVTCYQPVKSQCDDNPLITATGHKINLNHLKSGAIRWCAISRDLLYLFPLDSIIYIEGFGRYIIKDVMHKRMKHKVDILVHPTSKKRIYNTKVKIKRIK